VSDAIEDISGYSAAQFMRSTTHAWTNLIAPEDRKKQRRAVTEAIQTASRTKSNTASSTRRRRALGAGNGQPQPHEGDPVPWVDGIISDISQRKHNEMRIEALLAEQSAILDNVMFGVMFVRHRTIVSVNRRCEELFGYEPGAMAGASTAMLFPTPSTSNRGARQYRRCRRATTSAKSASTAARTAACSGAWSAAMRWTSNRANEGSIWVFADITERKEAEEKLRLSATVIEHIADGVVVLDARAPSSPSIRPSR
jgi:PAS domain S-box-containing protein